LSRHRSLAETHIIELAVAPSIVLADASSIDDSGVQDSASSNAGIAGAPNARRKFPFLIADHIAVYLSSLDGSVAEPIAVSGEVVPKRPPFPASMVNQKPADLGIPNQFSLNSFLFSSLIIAGLEVAIVVPDAALTRSVQPPGIAAHTLCRWSCATVAMAHDRSRAVNVGRTKSTDFPRIQASSSRFVLPILA
jgi:hypothetical protein